MSTPQIEDGHVRIANALLEAFLRAGLTANQWKVAMAIVRKTYGFNKTEDDLSASQIAEMCELARPHVAAALNQLALRNIITKRPGRFGSIVGVQKDHRKWVRLDKLVGNAACTDSVQGCTESVHVQNPYRGCTESVQSMCTESVHTKDNYPKDNHQKTDISTTDVVDVDSVAADEKPRRPAKKDCPHQQIIELYHEILPMCPGVRDWTPARQQQLRARWNENPRHQDVDYWRRYFEYVATCPFLVGQRTPRQGRPFFASLEWLTKAENFAKVRERRYEEQAA